MAITQTSDLVIPEILAEEFAKGIAGMNVLEGTGVFSVNPGLAQGSVDSIGEKVKVPYFESIGKAQTVPEGGALTPKRLSQGSEEGTLICLGDAVAIGDWAKRVKAQGKSLYTEAVRQLMAGFKASLEDKCMDALVARAVAGSMVYDGSSATFDVDAIVETQKLFGDELAMGGGIRLWAMQSKPYWDAATLADSTGRPLMVQTPGEDLMRIGGKPVAMSDRSSLIAGSGPTKYYSVAAKQAAGAVWFNQSVQIETARDPLAGVDLIVYRVFLVVHAYSVMASGTKPGVAAAKTL